MNKKRCLAAVAALTFGAFPFLAHAAQERGPEQLELPFSPAMADLGSIVSPVDLSNLNLNPTLDALPEAEAALPAAAAPQQLALFSDLPVVIAPPAALPRVYRPQTPHAPALIQMRQTLMPAVLPASEAAVEKKLAALTHELKPSLQTAALGYSSDGDFATAGDRIAALLSGEIDIGGPVVDISLGLLSKNSGSNGKGRRRSSTPWTPVHPADLYNQALEEAARTAARYGVKPEDIHLGEIKGALSSRDPHEVGFEFYIQPGKAEKNSGIIYVDFSRNWAAPGQRIGARTATFITNPKDNEIEPRYLSLEEFAKKAVYSPTAALEAARKRFPLLNAGASYLLRFDARDNGTDFWYHIYDSKEHAIAVNARTGKALDLNKNASAALKPNNNSTVKKGKTEGLPREYIEAAADSAAFYKGMPWSQSEYEMNLRQIEDRLITRGASEEDIELYHELCDQAPINNGRFNPWPGD